MYVELSRPILDTTTSSCARPFMYVKSPSFSGVTDGDLHLAPRTWADFMTYFGAFSLGKWRMYTGRPDLTPILRFESSAPLRVSLTGNVSHKTQKRLILTAEEPAGRTDDGWYSYEIAYPTDIPYSLVAFTLVSGDEPVDVRRVAYGAELPEGRDVRIEIVTTTFKKEKQVTGNIRSIQQALLHDPRWQDHFRLTVVDNGRSLEESVTQGDERITLIPNGNVGGAGGFAAGMIHALEGGWATNVLMMDDDVTVCPEAFKRTLTLLSHICDEYREGIVAGAMLSNGNFEVQQEDIGSIRPKRNLLPIKPRLFLDRVYDITFNEEILPRDDQPGMYSAWWYSCVPVDLIRDIGLPIPLFYRRDDVEYGTRAQERHHVRFMTMNGICVWHDPFDMRWNPTVEVYLATRNMLIQEAFTPDAMNSSAALVAHMRETLLDEGRRLNYSSMELICDAIQDYLRGPDYYRHPVGERLFKAAGRKAEKLVPLSQLPGMPSTVNIYDVERNANDPEIGYRWKIHDWIAEYGHRFTSKMWGDGFAIIPNDGWCKPWRVLHKAGTVLAVDPTGTKGAVRHLDARRFNVLVRRFDQLAERLLNDKTVAASYRKARSSMTTEEFWKGYLKEALEASK